MMSCDFNRETFPHIFRADGRLVPLSSPLYPCLSTTASPISKYPHIKYTSSYKYLPSHTAPAHPVDHGKFLDHQSCCNTTLDTTRRVLELCIFTSSSFPLLCTALCPVSAKPSKVLQNLVFIHVRTSAPVPILFRHFRGFNV